MGEDIKKMKNRLHLHYIIVPLKHIISCTSIYVFQQLDHLEIGYNQ